MTNKLRDKKNHTIDSIRYMLESYRRSEREFTGSTEASMPRVISSRY